MAWVCYAYVKHDIFVFLANDGGVLFGFFFTLSAYGVANSSVCFLMFDECRSVGVCWACPERYLTGVLVLLADKKLPGKPQHRLCLRSLDCRSSNRVWKS